MVPEGDVITKSIYPKLAKFLTIGFVFAALSAWESNTLAQEQSVEEAVRSVLENEAIQTELPEPEPITEIELPSWLEAMLEGIGSFFSGLGPLFEILFYVGVAAFVIWIIYFLVEKFEWRASAKEGKTAKAVKKTYSTEQSDLPVEDRLFSLEDADAFAADGNYSDAAHILLIVAIDFIQRKVRGMLAISETSREIIRNEEVEQQDRKLILPIVENVEKSLFAGHLMGQEEYDRCRSSFIELVQSNGNTGS